MKLKDASWKKISNPRHHFIKQRHHFANKGQQHNQTTMLFANNIVKAVFDCLFVFSSSHVQMWELDRKKGWAPKNWCFWNVVLEKTLQSPLDNKEIRQANPQGNQHWMFIGRTDDEAESPILWPPDVKSWLIRKDRDSGKDWRQEEKGTTEDEMFGWHHWFNGHELGQTLGDGEGQGSLVCCSPQDWEELNTTWRLNNNNNNVMIAEVLSPVQTCPLLQTHTTNHLLTMSLWMSDHTYQFLVGIPDFLSVSSHTPA